MKRPNPQDNSSRRRRPQPGAIMGTSHGARLWLILCACALLPSAGLLAQSDFTVTRIVDTSNRPLNPYYGDFARALGTNGIATFRDDFFNAIFQREAGHLESYVYDFESLGGNDVLRMGLASDTDVAPAGTYVLRANDSNYPLYTPILFRLGRTHHELITAATRSVKDVGTFVDFDFFRPVINSAGNVAFGAHLTNQGSGKRSGIFVATFSGARPTVQKVAMEGDSAGDGGEFVEFGGELAYTTGGLVAFEGRSNGPLGSGLFLGSPTGVTLVAPESSLGENQDFHLNNAAQFVRVKDSVIQLLSGGNTTTLVSPGDPTPDGSNFSALDRPLINEKGQVAFAADNDDGSSGLYLQKGTQLITIAKTGPARGGGDFTGFAEFLLNNSGQVLFSASVDKQTSTHQGIFESDGTDLLKLVENEDLLNGLVIDGTPSIPAQDHLTGHQIFNDAGQAAINLDLADTTGIYLFTPLHSWRTHGDGTWDDGSNWTLGAAPAPADDVVIGPDVASVITGPAMKTLVRSLKIGGGAGLGTLRLQPGVTLATTAGIQVIENGALTGSGIVSGNLVLGDGSTTQLTLGGTAPGTGYDSIQVTGTLKVAGAVEIALANGFTPQPGDQFNLFDWHARVGNFTVHNVTLPALPTGLSWDTSRLNSNGTIRIDSDHYFDAVKGTYTGLAQAGTPAFATSGLIKVTLTGNGYFTAALALAGQNHPFHGYFDITGHYRFTGVTGAAGDVGKSGDSVDLQLDLSNHTGALSGSISANGTTLASISAALPGYNAQSPTPLAGHYTVLFPPDPTQTGADYPQGTGYGALNVTAAGKATLAGVLGDGTAVSAGGVLSGSNTLPVYLPLYRGLGSFSGGLTVSASGAANQVQGSFAWSKPATSRGFYTAQFAGASAAHGLAYTPATRAQPQVLPAGAIKLKISGGNVPLASGEKDLTIGPGNKVTLTGGGKFSMSFTGATGLFSGTFYDDGEKGRKFRGAVLQSQDAGGGLFTGEGQTGSVTLTTQ